MENASSRMLPRNGTWNTKMPTSTAMVASTSAHHEVRQHLAEHHLGGPQRRGEHLLHGAHLPLARDGERGQQRGDDHEDHGDQPRHDVVLRFERAVVPDAQCARPRAAASGWPPRRFMTSARTLERRRSAPRFRRSPGRWRRCWNRCRPAGAARWPSRPPSDARRVIARNHDAHQDAAAVDGALDVAVVVDVSRGCRR